MYYIEANSVNSPRFRVFLEKLVVIQLLVEFCVVAAKCLLLSLFKFIIGSNPGTVQFSLYLQNLFFQD
jgi:hypothetical protein